MVRPILEYASPVWSPHTKKDVLKLERVQRQSVKFIQSDYSTYSSASNMLNTLNLSDLSYQRYKASKIKNNLILNALIYSE